ncbi:MAG TPA: hypothetical protein VEA37_06550, partial [Flavobacterium sp.]|nr:hypothetical protein [Flavobacterium sp.]
MKFKPLFFLILLCLLINYAYPQNGSFVYDGLSRNYILHLPPSYSSSSSLYPLVINMHGYSSNAAQQQLYTQMDVVADQE